MVNDFDRYRKAKQQHGGRVDESGSRTGGWVVVVVFAVVTAGVWTFAYQGYATLVEMSAERVASGPPSVQVEGETEFEPTHPGMLLRERESDELGLVFLDVGQGDAIFIQTPMGRNILIDTGTGQEAEFAVQQVHDNWNTFLRPFFRQNGIEKLDLFVSSHPHGDHMGAAPEMIRDFPIDEVWISGMLNPAGIQEDKFAAIEETGVPLNMPPGAPVSREAQGTLEQGMELDWGEDVGAWLLRTAPEGGPHESVNDASLTILLYYGETSVLLPGDTERPGERELMGEWGTQLDVDIYKASHHCSATSSTPEFVHFVKPDHSVCMVGYYNTYGHPVPAVVSRLSEYGEVHSTESSGTIYMFLDGEDIRIEKRPDYGVTR